MSELLLKDAVIFADENMLRNVKIYTKEGKEVDRATLSKELISFIEAQLADSEDNEIKNIIYTLLTPSLAEAILQVVEEKDRSLLVLGKTKEILTLGTVFGFVMYQYIRTHGLQLEAEERDMTDVEIEQMGRISDMRRAAIYSMFLGISYNRLLKTMLDNKDISEDDLEIMGYSAEEIEEIQSEEPLKTIPLPEGMEIKKPQAN
jgi:hypothetical protein